MAAETKDDTRPTSLATLVDPRSWTAFDPRGAAPLPRLPDGEKLAGRYVIEGLLGRGGFGEVYRVSDEQRPGRSLALKLHRVGSASRVALDALKSEFALLASLSHPNLAAVHDFGHVGDHAAFFTQTLIEGVRLDRAGLRPDDPDVLPIWAQLCRALEYLHTRGILHRDIKPSNVLVDAGRGHLTLLDFGVSRALGALDEGRLAGTIAYMAPEAIAGGAVDARADLYSLGVTLYQLAVDATPFKGTESDIVAAHVLDEAPPLPEDRISPEVSAVIMRLLRKNPGERYASAREVLAALAAAVGRSLGEEPQELLASYVLSAQFVGRVAHVERLLGAMRDHASAREVLLVTGEGGSGKSRLLRETRQHAQLEGRTWIEVSCPRGARERSILVDVARAAITPAIAAKLDEDDRVALARALPELRRPRERFTPPVDPERARRARIDALARALLLRFGLRPGVLAIDDLHWASGETLELVERLVAGVRAENVSCAILLAARPGPASARLVRALDAEELACGPLDPSATSALVESMFGARDLLDGTTLGDRLSGEPQSALFVQESLRLALETGRIVRDRGAFRVVGDLEAQPLADVLEARVARLGRDAMRLAIAIATVGEGTAGDIAEVAGQRLRAAAPALRDLVRAGLVEDRRDARNRVVYAMHDRFVDVVLDRTKAAERRSAHRRAGKFYARAARRDYRALTPAAEHLLAAGDLTAAVELLRQAATEAVRFGQPEQALHAIEREIGVHEKLGQVPVSAVIRWVDLAVRAGRRDRAEGALASLRASSRRATPIDRVAIALRLAQHEARTGQAARARRRCAAALAAARRHGVPELEHELLLLGAEIEETYGNVERGLEGYQAAAELAARIGDPALECRAWLGAAIAALRLGRATDAERLAERALVASEDATDPALRSEALRSLGNSARERGDIGASLRLYRRAVRAAREAGGPEAEAKALNNLGTVAQWCGHISEARAAMRRAIILKERTGAAHGSILLSWMNYGALAMCLGRDREAREALDRALGSEVATTLPTLLLLAHSNMGDWHFVHAELDRAIELYRGAAEASRERNLPQHAAHALSGLIRALLVRDRDGDLDHARRYAADFEALRAGGGLIEAERRFHTAAAMVADREGDPRRALAHARAALRPEKEQKIHFSDLFGTPLESRWIEAIALHRAGRQRAAARSRARAQALLTRLERMIDGDDDRRTFVERVPVHRAIRRGSFDLPLGWTWRPEDLLRA